MNIEILESRIAPATLIGLNDSKQLVTFDSASPGTIISTVTVSGIGADETLIGIDVRPATGGLYGITKDGSGAGRIYAINPTTAVATFSSLLAADPSDTADGNAPYTTLSGTNFGVDFNPVPDRLRVVSDTNQNLRINVDSGLVFTDLNINPGGSALTGAAYTNSFAGTGATQLFDIDTAGDRLVLQNPPNNGVVATVGTGLGIGDVTGAGGFDILSTRAANGTVSNFGFAALTVGGATGLYTIDLAAGTASGGTAIGTGAMALHGLTLLTSGTTNVNAFAIDSSNNHLVKFNTATPNTLPTDLGAISGLAGGDSIIGFDFRPADGQLYLVTKNGVNAKIYTVNTGTAVATPLGALVADPTDTTNPYAGLNGTSFGVDFNPVANRLRIVSDAAQNLRVNIDLPGVTPLSVITDGDLNGVSTTASAAAYTNNFAGATTTDLYDIDTTGTNDRLLQQTNPNGGTLGVIGALGVDATAVNGFDIGTNGQAFATLTVGGVANLYSINLTTGAATLVGAVNGVAGSALGLALAPSGAFQFSAPTLTVGEGAGAVTLTINRVGGSDGAVSVLVNTADGTATAGADYTALSRVVTFGPGVTSQNISIPIADDILIEGNENFTATLSGPAGGAALGTTKTATVTITDNEPVVPAASFIGLDAANHLLAFVSGATGTVTTTDVTGLGANETLIGIDFRPATGLLYGVTKNSVTSGGAVYLIDTLTGAATLSATLAADPADATSPFATLSGTNFGVDFNPAADRLRIVSNTGQNLRINVDTGFTTTDGDSNPGVLEISGAAYTNSFAGATSTVLYDLDVLNDQLVLQTPPNNGTLVPVGGLGVNASSTGGFDIVSKRAANGAVTDTAYSALTVGGVTGLYAINLATGTASSFGAIDTGATELVGLAAVIASPAATAFTIDANNGHLYRFLTATPTAATDLGAVTGIGAGEAIIGFDFRPSNGQLYVVTKAAGGVGQIYTLNTTTAAATLRGTLTADTVNDLTPTYAGLTGTNFGVDFNPVVDRLRIVSDGQENLRVNVDTFGVITDTNLNGAVSNSISAAYSNNFLGATATTLYDIDYISDSLYTQTPANNGTLTLVGALGVVTNSALNGFDIASNGDAFAALTVGGTVGLYSIDLNTGAATSLGALPGGPALGLAIAPVGVLQFSTPQISVSEDAGNATLTINRLGGSTGTVSVIVTTSPGGPGPSATVGADYVGLSRVVTFASGVTTQTINVPLIDDTAPEVSETFLATLTAPGGSLVTPAQVTTVTILDDEPTSLTDKALTFTDGDGDLVTLKITKGTLDATNFNLVGIGAGQQLVALNLSAAEFLNANVTITAKRGAAGGDGFVNLGALEAGANSLGTVSITGDLGRVNAATIKSLTVQSIGKLGLSTQAPGGSQTSTITGSLLKLSVKSDVNGALFNIGDDLGATTIGGNVIASGIHIADRLASLSVLGDVRQTLLDAKTSGAIKIRGDLDSTAIRLAGNTAPNSAKLANALASLAVTGSVSLSKILVGVDPSDNAVNADVTTGAIKVGGDWFASTLAVGIDPGGDGIYGNDNDLPLAGGSATIVAKIASISIKGQVAGTPDSVSSTDRYGFLAELIGSFTVGKTKFPLNARTADNFTLGPTGDVRVRDFLNV